MTRIASNMFLRKITAIYMVVTLLLVNFPVTAFADGLSVDLRVDGKKSLTLTDPNQSFTITLSTQNAAYCHQNSPVDSGIGSTLSMTISPSDGAYYPQVGQSITYSVTCTDANNVSISDSVTVSLEPTPPAPAPILDTPTPTIDVKANGSDGPVTINSGDAYTYTWNSTNATSCLLTSPINSGASIAGDSGPITSGSFYPTTSSPVTITITCSNGSNSATDSVVVNLASTSTPPTPGAVTADVKANGSDGPVTINSGDAYTYTWNSTGATSCLLTSPINSGLSLAGDSGPITSGVFYPATSSPVTITINCTNGTNSATDSVVINLASGTITPSAVTVDVKANGSDGTVTINSGDSYTYTWNSTGATSCLTTSPINSGTSIAGDSGPISTGVYYPATNSPVTITITCTNGTNSATDSVVINLASGTNTLTPTIDVKANGSDGPITINSGDAYTYTWNSTNATSCLLTSPINSGASLAGDSGPITSGVFYPTTSSAVTITITCTNGANSATDSVVVNLAQNPQTPAVTVDVKANGSDGPVVLNNGEPYTYTWNSTNANSCELTSPINSGISIAGTSLSITSGNADFYPAVGGSKTITITCVNQTSSATDSVVISVRQDNGNPPSCPVPEITSSLTASVNEDANFSYTLTSSANDAVLTTSNLPSGLTFSTSTNVISGIIAVPGTYNITLTATNGCGSTTKTLVLTVNNVGGGGGGDNNGGGSSSGGRRHHRGGGTVKGEEFQCLWLTDYMRRDFNNDPIQVMRLQAFLVGMEGHSEVTINGVFDQTTFDAVSAFQMKYKDDILTPWGHTGPTGYVYILTLKKVNELYCHNVFPLNEAQLNEIAAFRALLEGLRAQGYNVDGYYDHFYPTKVGPGKTIISEPTSSDATTTPAIPIVGKNIFKGQNLKNIAAALFTLPHSWMEGLQCLYEFILILIVLYVLASVLEDALSKKTGVDVEKKFRNKWMSIVAGLVISIILAYIFKEWCLMLPLVVALILSVIWIMIRPNHSSIKASFKSWYLVLMARSKSIANNAKNSAKANMEKIGEKKEEVKSEVTEKKEEIKTLVKKEEEPKTDNK